MMDGSCSVSYIFRKQNFDAIKALRRDKKNHPDGRIIPSYNTQHNTTSLKQSFVLDAFKLLLEKNLLKSTPKKGGDSYYVVSEDSSTAITSDANDTESNSQEGTPSYR